MTYVRLKIDGDPVQMNVVAALDALSQMARLLGQWDEESSPRWRPVAVRIASLTIDVAPAATEPTIVDRAIEQARQLSDGIVWLGARASLPPNWSAAKVRRLRKIGKALNSQSGVAGIVIEVEGDPAVQITPTTLDHALEAIRGVATSYGSVTGTLDILNLRGRDTRLQLLDETNGDDVVCHIATDMLPQAVALLNHRVTMEGILERNLSGNKVSIKVTSIAEAPSRPSTPISQLVGILGSDWTGGVDSVDWVRRQRD